jgi:hypothetical protein
MLSYILIGVAVAFALFLIVAALQPAAFYVERKASMKAPASAIYPHVADMRSWIAWSPWEKVDPTMKRTYEGVGPGATYEWTGNKAIGEGRVTMLETRPDELVKFRLEFFKPFVATNEGQLTFKPQGEQTEVTWSMAGNKSLMFKAMGLLMSMDKMCGGEFEKGLSDLKSIVETARQQAPGESRLAGV